MERMRRNTSESVKVIRFMMSPLSEVQLMQGNNFAHRGRVLVCYPLCCLKPIGRFGERVCLYCGLRRHQQCDCGSCMSIKTVDNVIAQSNVRITTLTLGDHYTSAAHLSPLLARELRRGKYAEAKDKLFYPSLNLQDETWKLERELISKALARVDGRITHAAKLLGINYQSLAFIIEDRHPDLVKQRSPIHRRPRK